MNMEQKQKNGMNARRRKKQNKKVNKLPRCTVVTSMVKMKKSKSKTQA